ncbi:hypothetical protein J41TS4_19750 [Paenibacillus apis]|uniref:Uncharacterized protein n=1 Tax=Paenibacillus apis TaxID=1792174 RepID=A0A919Y4Z6_9BACL|nr:hypothetical protein J41TS4_19750 [Paenibacillus apis]
MLSQPYLFSNLGTNSLQKEQDSSIKTNIDIEDSGSLKTDILFPDKLIALLNEMPTDNGNFFTNRLDYNIGSLDQTYYRLKLQHMFNIPYDKKVAHTFSKELLHKQKEDPSNSIYLDLVAEISKKDNHNSQMPKDLYNEYTYQITCNCADSNPYLVYSLSKAVYVYQNEKSPLSLINLGNTILKSNIDENLIYYLYWYFDLLELGFPPSENNDRIIDIAKKLKYELNDEILYSDIQTLYNYILISKQVDNKFIVDPGYLNLMKDRLSYIFNAYELYYSYKILEIYDIKAIENYSDLFKQFHAAILTTSEHLYPIYVVEENNKIEMLQWQIIMSKLLNIDTSPNDLTTLLSQYISKSLPSNSTMETYYQVLFSYLNNLQYPFEKVEALKKSLQLDDNSMMSKYYLYQAYHLLGFELSSQEIDKLKSESQLSLDKKDEWGMVVALDIWLTFKIDQDYSVEYWDKIKGILKQKESVMTDETFYHYQILKRSMGEKLEQAQVANHFNIRKIDDMVVIKGERGEMDINSIYYYASLLKMSQVTSTQVQKQKEYIFR